MQVTDLSDRVPWGLWITLDLSMIALGAGAFTFSAAVYIFRIKASAARSPAVFIGFLGYSGAMLALAMDIGRPDRFWHPIVYWNVHSVLWEMTWCVILYSIVLVMEALAVTGDLDIGERWPWFEAGRSPADPDADPGCDRDGALAAPRVLAWRDVQRAQRAGDLVQALLSR